MNSKKILTTALLLFVVFSVIYLFINESNPKSDDVTEQAIPVASSKSPNLMAYYFHSNRRCVSCKKIEAFSNEAITLGFAEQLQDSSMVWQIVNYESEGNEHFVKEFELYTQSLIIIDLDSGEKVRWKNLEKVWEYLDDKDKFIEYVKTEIGLYLGEV